MSPDKEHSLEEGASSARNRPPLEWTAILERAWGAIQNCAHKPMRTGFVLPEGRSGLRRRPK